MEARPLYVLGEQVQSGSTGLGIALPHNVSDGTTFTGELNARILSGYSFYGDALCGGRCGVTLRRILLGNHTGSRKEADQTRRCEIEAGNV